MINRILYKYLYCIISQNPLHLEVRQVHGSEGRSIAVDVKPEQLLVQMRICHLHECRTSIAFTKNLILSDLNPYCFYNLTAIDVHDPNNTVTEGFLTDLGSKLVIKSIRS